MLPCFHRNLAHLRKLKKVNQREAAAALGVSQALLSHYEKGLREPGMEFLLNAADYYGVSADWLLGRTSDMTGTFLGAGTDVAATTEADPSRRAAARRRADKARMQESVGMVYDLLEKLDARELEPAVHAHLSAELVQILSLIHLSAGRGSRGKDLFGINRRYLRTALEIWQAKAEQQLVRLSLEMEKAIRPDAPSMSAEFIEQEFGERGERLTSALRETADTITACLEEKL